MGIMKRTRFYDLNVHALPDFADSPDRMIREARKLGYSGMCLSSLNPTNTLHEPVIAIPPDFEVYTGIEILVDTAAKMKKNVARLREKADIIMIGGGSEDVNRAAVEDGRVDILADPTSRGIPLNHVLAKAAADNGVAVDFNADAFIFHRGGSRIRILSAMRKNVQLARKYDVPMIMTSNARSHYDLRAPREMMALGMIAGMTREEAFLALSFIPDTIIKRNLDRNRIMEGVEVLD